MAFLFFFSYIVYIICKLVFILSDKLIFLKRVKNLFHNLIIRFEYNAIVELVVME